MNTFFPLFLIYSTELSEQKIRKFYYPYSLCIIARTFLLENTPFYCQNSLLIFSLICFYRIFITKLYKKKSENFALILRPRKQSIRLLRFSEIILHFFTTSYNLLIFVQEQKNNLIMKYSISDQFNLYNQEKH